MGFLDKLFWGASKRLANDVSRIAGNEMKKKILAQKEQPERKTAVKQSIVKDDPQMKERAPYINRLKTILTLGVDDISDVNDMLDFLNEIDKIKINNQLLNAVWDKAWEKDEIREEIRDELDNMWDLGDEFGDRTGDYTVKFQSRGVEEICSEIRMMFYGIVDIVNMLRKKPYDEEDFNKEIKVIQDSALAVISKIEEKHEQLLRYNRQLINDKGQSYTIDYND
ncbi:hypothetical protein [Gottfriedia acidiceleris]|uniref:hypothetical protein n=1 Tax=Gottfriedia acidiceleris TaxID=371036 RepID=UPI0030004196